MVIGKFAQLCTSLSYFFILLYIVFIFWWMFLKFGLKVCNGHLTANLDFGGSGLIVLSFIVSNLKFVYIAVVFIYFLADISEISFEDLK